MWLTPIQWDEIMRLRELLHNLTFNEGISPMLDRLQITLRSYSQYPDHPLKADVMSLLDHSISLAEGFASADLSADDVSNSIAILQSVQSRMLLYANGARHRLLGYSLRLPNGEIYQGFYHSPEEAEAARRSFSRLGLETTVITTRLASASLTSPLHQPAAVPLSSGSPAVTEAQLPIGVLPSTAAAESRPPENPSNALPAASPLISEKPQ